MKKSILIICILSILFSVLVYAAIYQEPWIQNQLGDQHNLTDMDYIEANTFSGNVSAMSIVVTNLNATNLTVHEDLIVENNAYVGTGTEWLSIYLSGSIGYFNSTVTIEVTNNFTVDDRLGIGTKTSNSKLQVNGSISTAISQKTSNYILTISDSIILANASQGNVTISLPTASAIAGRKYTIKGQFANSSHQVIVNSSVGSQTIDGEPNQTITIQYTSLDLVSDGSNWYII